VAFLYPGEEIGKGAGVKSSVDVHTYLVDRGVPHEFFRLEALARDVSDMATQLDVAPGSFANAAVLMSRTLSVLTLTPVSADVDLEAASATLGTSLRLAGPAASSLLTGFPALWTAPVPVMPGLRLLIDASLAARDIVYGTAGEPGLVLSVRIAELIRAADATLSPIARPVASVA
jgi:prolyl-tRNA editing enzyme YbaK/EbsC (Cys-tRNA(Pro) deacylase)